MANFYGRWTLLRCVPGTTHPEFVEDSLDVRHWHNVQEHITDYYINDDKNGTVYVAVDCLDGMSYSCVVDVVETRVLKPHARA